tara:strand:+ start:180 stop:374 length:195 start_codon:yes stop_codon:yes gene_type:complete
MMEWQPIETAPKNETRILLAGEGFVCECRWYHDDWQDPVYNEWSFEAIPTHWMPLPEPPKGDNM